MTTYHVTVTREDGVWIADIDGPGLGPAATDVERFADLDVEVRDLVAGLTDTDPDDFDLIWRYIIDGTDVTRQVSDLLAAEHDLTDVSARRERARAQALEVLHGAGVSQATIGDVLGLSHQRVHQLLKAST